MLAIYAFELINCYCSLEIALEGIYLRLSVTTSKLQNFLKVIENFEPTPTSLDTLTLPPICSTIYLQMLSPRPLPVGFFF
jgi:hypothetical protein